MRRALLLAATLLLAVHAAGPAAAQAGGVIDRAVVGLRASPVYVDPASEKARHVDVDRLRRRISSAGTPIFVAVLPAAAAEESGGDAGRVATELGRRLRSNGTYVAVAGTSVSAASSMLPAGRAAAIAGDARQAHSPDDVEAVLNDFVDRVRAAAPDGAGEGGEGGETRAFDDRSGEGGGGPNLLLILLLLAAGAGGFYLWQRKRRRDEAARDAEEAEDRSLLEAELSVLADDVMTLEPQVAVHPEAAEDYEAGASRFRVAQAALAQADDPIDLVRVRRVVDEASYAMSRARARVQGREPSPPPPDLARPGRRGEPAVDLDDDGRPAYVGYGSPFYGGGWFGGGGGLLTGLFLGQMLGGGWGGHDTNVHVEGGGGGNGGDGGGDWGGDFGGGDFGGGDFGGGDFGGGDFGGGDF